MFCLMIGKKKPMQNVAIQLTESPKLCAVATASTSKYSEISRKGIGPSPSAKLAMMLVAATADKILMFSLMPMARSREETVMPASETSRRTRRPVLSIRLAAIKVTSKLTTDMPTEIQAERSGSSVARILVE